MTSDNVTLAQLVMHHGEVVSEIYGPDVTAQTTLISWSMAKSVTHALVGIAQMDGLLNVSDSHLFSQWEADERRNITLQQLLEMRSGLSWVEDYVDGDASDVIDMLFGSGKNDNAGYAIAQPLTSNPGAEWVYSSAHPEQRIYDCISGDQHPVLPDTFCQQVLLRLFRRRVVPSRYSSSQFSVDLFRPGRIDVPSTKPGLHVAHRNFPVIRGKRCKKRRRCVTMHQHTIRPKVLKHLPHAGHHPAAYIGEVLVRPHDLQVIIRAQLEKMQNLVKHPAMLPRNTEPALNPV